MHRFFKQKAIKNCHLHLLYINLTLYNKQYICEYCEKESCVKVKSVNY